MKDLLVVCVCVCVEKKDSLFERFFDAVNITIKLLPKHVGIFFFFHLFNSYQLYETFQIKK